MYILLEMLDIIGRRPDILKASCIPYSWAAINDISKTGIHLYKKLFFMKQWFQLSKIFKCFLSHGEELDWVLTARMLSRSRMGRPLSMYRMSSSGRFHSDTWLLRVLGPRCMWTGINVLGDFCSRWSADKTVNKKNKNIDNDIFSIKMSHSKNQRSSVFSDCNKILMC